VRWRLLRLEGDAAFNMAVDEALLRSRVPTVRFYRFRPSAVTIGYFQRVESSVNLKEAERLGVPVVRRITGGGAVYHDERGELTYSVAGPLDLFPKDVRESFRYLCEGVMGVVRRFGLEPQFAGVNDVLIGGRKVSGSAQTREGGVLLQHGTIMYATDLVTLARLISPPREKLSDKGVRSVLERVTTIGRELGREIGYEEVLEAALDSFSFLGEMGEGDLTEEEWKHVEELEEKYRSRRWNFRR